MKILIPDHSRYRDLRGQAAPIPKYLENCGGDELLMELISIIVSKLHGKTGPRWIWFKKRRNSQKQFLRLDNSTIIPSLVMSTRGTISLSQESELRNPILLAGQYVIWSICV